MCPIDNLGQIAINHGEKVNWPLSLKIISESSDRTSSKTWFGLKFSAIV